METGAHRRLSVGLRPAYLARPVTTTDPGRVGIFAYVTTINLKDYIKARADNELVPRTADEILATECSNACFKFARDYTDSKYFSLVFDQKEPFRGHVIDRSRNSKMIRQFPFFGKIISNTEADAKFEPALQLADLFAYCYSHKRDKEEKFKWERKMLAHPLDEGYGFYENLITPIEQNVFIQQVNEVSKEKDAPLKVILDAKDNCPSLI